MKIAVIGWGSLIWDIEKNTENDFRVTTPWHKNGPKLPVEFLRVSDGGPEKNGRLTLVIALDGFTCIEPVTTLWALSEFRDLKIAKENLRKRERCNISMIGCVNNGVDYGKPTERIISAWLTKIAADVAIWTNLDPRDINNIDDAVDYAREKAEINPKIKEYICKTPKQIETKVRKELQKEPGWENDTRTDEFICRDPKCKDCTS